MNESLLSEVDWGAHDSSVFLFLVNIDYDAKPNESSIQRLWGELHHRTSSILLIGLQTDSLVTGQLEMIVLTPHHLTQTMMTLNSSLASQFSPFSPW